MNRDNRGCCSRGVELLFLHILWEEIPQRKSKQHRCSQAIRPVLTHLSCTDKIAMSKRSHTITALGAMWFPWGLAVAFFTMVCGDTVSERSVPLRLPLDCTEWWTTCPALTSPRAQGSSPESQNKMPSEILRWAVQLMDTALWHLLRKKLRNAGNNEFRYKWQFDATYKLIPSLGYITLKWEKFLSVHFKWGERRKRLHKYQQRI